MRPEIAKQLIALNREFYSTFAESFAETRRSPQPGFTKLLAFLPNPCRNVLDIGCGNGRFGLFIKSWVPSVAYTGVDYATGLLEMAAEALDGVFLGKDISQAGFLAGQDNYDLCVCLATLQHIPGEANRLAIVREMAEHLAEDGRIMLSNWQFLDSRRQKRKILPWQTIDLSPEDVDPNDFLLSWQRNGHGVRYVHYLDQAEVSSLAAEAGLRLIDNYRSDGKEGNLNLYSILAK